jgi:carbon-monoxide dehydrogenase medium subunit
MPKRLWTTVLQPRSLDEALAMLREQGDGARVVAGGTDLVVETTRGVKRTGTIIDITGIDVLRGILESDEALVLGALATHNDVIAHRGIVEHALPLAQACAEIGAPQLRTRATIAGNIATASPANDTISALIALDATVTMASLDGERTVGIDAFFEGFRKTILRPDELITSISIPKRGSGSNGVFRKLGLRRAQAISVIHFAITIDRDGDIVRGARIALGCVAATVIHATEAEEFLIGRVLDEPTIVEAARKVTSAATPIDDVRGSGAYRSLVLERSFADALDQLASGEERRDWPSRPVLLNMEGPRDGAGTTINGQPVQIGDDLAGCTLLNALRDHFRLTGSKEGCAEGECGACTVWIDGQAVMSCLVPAAQARGHAITTVEGLARTADAPMHPLQQAFVDAGAVQCGFCIPGMVMAGAKLLAERPDPHEREIREALAGNLCRCTGYAKIIDAVRQAAHAE